MKVFIVLLLSVILLSAFDETHTLSGKWMYAGDIFNGKKEGGPSDYTLQRKYSDTGFVAYVIQKGYNTEEYETGTYKLTSDSCFETQTWCAQESKLLNIPVHYHYSFNKDTLVLTGILPNGAAVEEYWKRAK